MKKVSAITGILLLLIIMAGCGPSYVTVGTRPGAPLYARPMAPGPHYIWVEGEWVSRGRGYVYRRGYWTIPRKRHHEYIQGHWERSRQGWHWSRGHWN